MMNRRVDPTRKTTLVIAMVATAAILVPVGWSVVRHIAATDKAAVQAFLERPPPRYTECVRETEYMRFHHWELLRKIREAVVRHGERGDITLARCRECHASRERFCDRCHLAASVTPDCFGCHYYPARPPSPTEKALQAAAAAGSPPPTAGSAGDGG
jgi:hypothetical protein